jgi:nucleoside-diphosphate-sugar epimerase
MPSIVYGPRSQWIAKLANQTIERTAYLINGGRGICNAVYVDNLVEAAHLALNAPNVDGESFFVSDTETVTWEEFYLPVLSALGASLADIRYIDPQVFTVSVKDSIRGQMQVAAEAQVVQRLKPHVPPALKKIYKGVLSWTSPAGHVPTSWLLPEQMPLDVALDMNYLQQCAYKLPNTKAERLLSYRPKVSFAEGMSRSVAWLKFAGYPVAS